MNATIYGECLLAGTGRVASDSSRAIQDQRKPMLFVDEKLERYPLRQPLSPGVAGLAIFMRRGLVEWLSKPDSYLVICEGEGGWIYAANERTLAEAQQEIEAVHGTAVIHGAPEIRTFQQGAHGAIARPVMFLRLKMPRGYVDGVVDELDRRGVRILETDLRRLQAVIRAEGRLADLLGCEKAVQGLTNGAATMWIWLVRYEAAETSTTATAARPRTARAGGRRQRLEEQEEAPEQS